MTKIEMQAMADEVFEAVKAFVERRNAPIVLRLEAVEERLKDIDVAEDAAAKQALAALEECLNAIEDVDG